MNSQMSRLLRGELTSAELPELINLGDLNAAMNELWKQSIRDIDKGTVTEWGGVLVLDAGGNLKLVNQVAGTAGCVVLDPSRIGEDETFVGTFHTHPYESGLTGMAFSGADIAGVINQGKTLSLVQSGDVVFAVVRTEKTPEQVDSSAVDGELDGLYRSYAREGLLLEEAAFLANLDICAKYGLAFYWGEIFGELQEVYRP